MTRQEERRQRQEIMLIAETMAVEGGQAIDILVDLEHKARVEYEQHGDRLTVDTTQGEFEN